MPPEPNSVDSSLYSQSEVVRSIAPLDEVMIPNYENTFASTIDKLGEAFINNLKTRADPHIYSDILAELDSGKDQDAPLEKDAYLKQNFIEGLSKPSSDHIKSEVAKVFQIQQAGDIPSGFRKIQTYLPSEITVENSWGPYNVPGTSVEEGKTKNGYKCTYKWSTPECSTIQIVDRFYRPLFKPDSDINKALSMAETKRTIKIREILLNSASESVQALIDALPEEKATLKANMNGWNSEIQTNRWLTDALDDDISTMILEKAQKGLSGLDDPTSLQLVATWESEGVKGFPEDILTLTYVDSKETPTHLNWFADIERPSTKAFELSDLVPSRKRRMPRRSHGQVN